jgi:hypothetical protein
MKEEDFIDKYIYSETNFLFLNDLAFTEWQESEGN